MERGEEGKDRRAVLEATYDKNSMESRRDDFRYLASRAGWIIDRLHSLAGCYYMEVLARMRYAALSHIRRVRNNGSSITK